MGYVAAKSEVKVGIMKQTNKIKIYRSKKKFKVLLFQGDRMHELWAQSAKVALGESTSPRWMPSKAEIFAQKTRKSFVEQRKSLCKSFLLECSECVKDMSNASLATQFVSRGLSKPYRHETM